MTYEHVPIMFPTGMTLESLEKAIILKTLIDNNHNRTKAAKALGLGIRTIQRRIRQYDLPSPTVPRPRQRKTDGIE